MRYDGQLRCEVGECNERAFAITESGLAVCARHARLPKT